MPFNSGNPQDTYETRCVLAPQTLTAGTSGTLDDRIDVRGFEYVHIIVFMGGGDSISTITPSFFADETGGSALTPAQTDIVMGAADDNKFYNRVIRMHDQPDGAHWLDLPTTITTGTNTELSITVLLVRPSDSRDIDTLIVDAATAVEGMTFA